MFYFLSILASIVFAEFVAYWLHILLHSEKVPALSRAHMLHHLRDYSPNAPLHRDEYISSADNRANFLGIGMEWMVPILSIIGLTVAVMSLLGVKWQYQATFLAFGILWGFFMLGYMHTSQHLKKFWMHRVPLLKAWHRNMRKLHDYHHLQISTDGRMLKNYGIGFFWFDRIFGSYSPHPQPFNKAGHEAALERYKDLLNS